MARDEREVANMKCERVGIWYCGDKSRSLHSSHWLLLPVEDTVEGTSFSYFSWRGVKDTLFCPIQTVTPTGLSTEHRKMEARQPKETLPSLTLKPMIYLECSTEDTEMN